MTSDSDRQFLRTRNSSRRASGFVIAIVALTGLASACSGDKISGVGCLGPIALTAVDSVSANAITSAIVTLRYPSDTTRVNGDNLVDTLANWTQPLRIGQDAGSYQISISSVGYSQWRTSLTNVPDAGSSPCASPLQVNARMVRNP